ncbi:MAG: arylamine N-acetyltransferase [Arenibacterium sp.]
MTPKSYLDRIHFFGTASPDLATLFRLTNAHLSTIPFENLDQQMGVAVSTDLERVYDKVVLRQRGGWCFELNGLFAWLLQEIGFDVAMHAGFVTPDKPAKDAVGDHMFLIVNCGGPYLVDVGFGGGPWEPVPLRGGVSTQPPYTITISPEDDGWYRYSETTKGNDGCYWFTLDAVDTSYFRPSNLRLQTDPTSSFKRTLTAQRRFDGKHVVLRGLVKKTYEPHGVSTEHLRNEEALVHCLLNDFGLDVPQISSLWPSLKKRHDALFPA